MTTPFRVYIAGGIVRAEIGFYDDDGLFCAGARDLDEGEDAGMIQWVGVKQIDYTAPERVRETQTGDDRRLGTLTFEPAENAVLGIQMGAQDMDREADFTNTNVYDDDQMAFVTIDPIIDTEPLVSLITHGQAKREEFGAPPQKGWEVNIFNAGEISVGGPDSITERTLRNYDYSMNAEQTFRYPWMETFTKENQGTLGGAGGRTTLRNWLTLHAFRGDDTATSFTLDYLPLGDEDSDFIRLYSTDLATLVTSVVNTADYTVNTETGVVTFTAGAFEDEHIVARYQHRGVRS